MRSLIKVLNFAGLAGALAMLAVGARISGGVYVQGNRNVDIQSRALGSPALGATNAVHAALAVLADPAVQTVSTGITNPATPRNITATSAGTAGDIRAVQVTVNGTDEEDNVISEVLPIFTVDSATTVVGNKAFKTVTSYSVPGMDGTGATVAIGVGAKLGIGERLTRNTVLKAYLNGVLEGTAPTVVFDATNISGNTAQLNSALAGTPVILDYYSS